MDKLGRRPSVENLWNADSLRQILGRTLEAEHFVQPTRERIEMQRIRHFLPASIIAMTQDRVHQVAEKGIVDNGLISA